MSLYKPTHLIITSSSNKSVNQAGRIGKMLCRGCGMAEVTEGFLSLTRPFHNLLAVIGQLGCGHSIAPGYFFSTPATPAVLHPINNKGQTEAKTMSK